MKEKIQIRKRGSKYATSVAELTTLRPAADYLTYYLNIANTKNVSDAMLIRFKFYHGSTDVVTNDKERLSAIRSNIKLEKEVIRETLDFIIENKEVPEIFVPPNVADTDIFLKEYFEGVIFMLSSFSIRSFLRKIKKCPYCTNFFIARDTKRKICYESQCFREYKKIQKQRQREADPVKYI